MEAISDLIGRTPVPEPWAEGDNIPWNDPGFSERMLREHLSQAHDGASRRLERIEAQVGWIDRALLGEGPRRVLDLGCGPGLYTSRLSALGHCCTGIDYSPASIAHARAHGDGTDGPQTYVEGDIRQTGYGEGFDLVMLIFGELNVFCRADALQVLSKAHGALAPGGTLLLEPHTTAAVTKRGQAPRSWYSSPTGLFSDRPHLVLQENVWDEESQTATNRYFVIDAQTQGVTRYASSTQAYDDAAYRTLLEESGFGQIRTLPSLTGGEEADPDGYGLSVWVATRAG